jgi:hypothetical protein
VDDLVEFVLFHVEVGNFQRRHGLQGAVDDILGSRLASFTSQVVPESSQRSENPRTIESLSLAVLAEAHVGASPSISTG